MEPRTAVRGEVPEERYLELVDARWQHSLRYNWSLLNKLQSYYNTFRGVYQGRLSQFRNNITIPFTFSTIMSDVARKVQASFGTWPIVIFEGYAPEDVPIAKKREVMISAQMKDADSIIKATDFFLQADICGTAISRIGWKKLKRKQVVRRRETIAPGMDILVRYEYEAEQFNGPIWEPVDRLDFGQQPGKKNIEDMAWVCHRYYLDLDDMLEDARDEYSYFNPAAVKRLREFPMDGGSHASYVQRKLAFRNEYDEQVRSSERFAKPIEIIEMHGIVPPEFAVEGVRHVCFAIGNKRVLLKRDASVIPGWKPFRSYAPMPDPYQFDGIGKAEVAYGPQRTADRLNNQKLDAIDLIIDPMWVASSQANLNTQHLYTRAGRVLLVEGAADDSNIRALSPNMNGLQAAYSEIGQMWQFMQMGTGMNDIVLGINPNQDETARGALARQEGAMTRLAFEARLAEEGFIEKLANDFVRLDREFLPLPYQSKILGSLATVNPITGLPYPAEPVSVDADDLVPDYRARAVGASQMMGKSLRQQNFVGLLQMMSANPALLQLVNWANFARQMFDLFDFKNVDELLVNQVPMISQMADQMGQSPQAVAGAVSQPMNDLNPQVLSQMMAAQNPAPIPMMSR